MHTDLLDHGGSGSDGRLAEGQFEAFLWAGRPQEAIEVFIRVEKEKLVLFASGARVSASCDLALIYAILGDLPSAERWVDEAERRIRKMKNYRLPQAAKLCWAHATVLARKGQYEATRDLLDSDMSLVMSQFAVCPHATVFTDGQLCVNTFTKRADSWVACKWRRKDGVLDLQHKFALGCTSSVWKR